MYAGGVEKTSLSDIRSFAQSLGPCVIGSGTDSVDMTTTRYTSLRYDTTALR